MKYKLIISDYDGTLGDLDGIDGQSVSAIKEYISNGGKFCVCTGRPYISIREILLGYGINEGLVGCLQGAQIYDLKEDKEIFACPIPKDIAVKIIKRMSDDGMEVTVWTKDGLYYERENYYQNRYKESIRCVKLIKVDNLIDFFSEQDRGVLKIASVCPDEKISYFCTKYNGDADFNGTAIFNSGAKFVCECVNKLSTKADNVKFIAKHYNIDYKEVMTVGDSTNDLEMVKGSWHGVAVGDGKDELKAVAKEVTVPFKENPVKYLIEKYK